MPAATARRRLLLGQAPFNPKKIPNLESWFDATQMPAVADGTAIGTWSDLSGKGRDLTQATAGKKPLYKTNIINANSTVRTDGVDDCMAQAAFTAIAQPGTMFMAAKVIAADAVSRVFFDGIAAGNRWLLDFLSSTFNYFSGSANISDGAADTNWHVHVLVINGASSKYYKDGGAAAASGNGGAHSITGFTLGDSFSQAGTGALNFDTLGFGFYSSALSLSDINRLGRYYAKKIATTWTTAT